MEIIKAEEEKKMRKSKQRRCLCDTMKGTKVCIMGILEVEGGEKDSEYLIQ